MGGVQRRKELLVVQEKPSWRWHFRWAESIYMNGKSREMGKKGVPDRMAWAKARADEGKRRVLLGEWNRVEEGVWRAVVSSRLEPGHGQLWTPGSTWRWASYIAVHAEPSLLQSFPERRPTSSCLFQDITTPQKLQVSTFPCSLQDLSGILRHKPRDPHIQ